MTDSAMNVAFVGLGAMGGRMAGVLMAAGHQVTGYDRVAEALKALEAKGGRPAESAAAACAGADALVLMVVNAEQATAVLFDDGALDALPKGALVISCVTMPAAASEADRAAGRGARDGSISTLRSPAARSAPSKAR